ncbi:hypothetical protein HanXRQr2_Chr09g0373091 [Helianthus annuus]|uniref:Uncharacterized protein n=1 Tax=Helianthus annuus TaxID=4232 RepID=A0A9K3N771_HELAN|nr:hypothetical protein HanXRQr2_Chr09g0373091 [Helianthus annuus]
MARKGNPISVRNYQSILIDILIYLVLTSLLLTLIKLGIPIMAFCDSLPPISSLNFFCITKLNFSQTMPMLWRVLLVLDRIKNAHIPELFVHDLPLAYRLRSHGSCRFLFYSTSNDPLILRATRNEEEWKSNFFFVKRNLIPGGADYPVKWLRKADFRILAPPLADSKKRIQAIRLLLEIKRSFIPYPASSSQHSSSNMSDASKVPILLDLDEHDSYPTPTNVKKQTPAAASSKPVAVPKPNRRTHASTPKKRKGSDTTTPASEGFSYEELSFIESLEPMTSFLNKVISWF